VQFGVERGVWSVESESDFFILHWLKNSLQKPTTKHETTTPPLSFTDYRSFVTRGEISNLAARNPLKPT